MTRLTSIFIGLLAAALVAVAVMSGVSRTRQPQEPGQEETVSQRPSAPEPDEPEPDNAPASLEEEAVPALSNAKMGWGPGKEVNDRNQTTGSIDFQNKYGDLGAYFIMPEDDGMIYLTFDLGYENGYTESILDTLAQYNVKATFFVTQEYVDEAPYIVERIIREGHTLGNHTVKHPSMPDVTDMRARSEIMDLHNFVLEKYGYEMKLFRYPMGEFSEHSLSLVNDLGYKSVFWSFAYKDWVADAQPDPAASLKRITGALHDGAIYLLHAVSSTNDQIMGEFVQAALDQGYEFALLDQRLGLVEPDTEPDGTESIF